MNTQNNEKIVAGTWSGSFVPPESIPERADVVIIGGGIVGVSTAWFLARQGIDVVLCEKGHIAGEQSGRNWGWVRQHAYPKSPFSRLCPVLKGVYALFLRVLIWQNKKQLYVFGMRFGGE